MGYTEEDHYTLDSEMMDSIRMEYSSLSPEEQKLITDLAVDIRTQVINEFGEFISPKERVKFSNIENRILVLSEDNFSRFEEDWYPQSDVKNSKVSGKFLLIGDFVVMPDMKDRARTIWDENKNNFHDTVNINDEAMITIMQYSLIITTLVHEFIHSTQDESVEKNTIDTLRLIAFSECGASYITEQILKTNYQKLVPLVTKNDKQRIEVFKQILNKYGEDTYNAFFNNKPDNVDESSFLQLKEKIYNEFDSKTLVDIGIIKEDQVSAFESLRMSRS